MLPMLRSFGGVKPVGALGSLGGRYVDLEDAWDLVIEQKAANRSIAVELLMPLSVSNPSPKEHPQEQPPAHLQRHARSTENGPPSNSKIQKKPPNPQIRLTSLPSNPPSRKRWRG